MKIENIKNLDGYDRAVIQPVDLDKLPQPQNPVDFIDKTQALSQILVTDPRTGFPVNDLDVLENSSTSPEVKEFLKRCLSSIPSVDNSNLSDEDLEELHYSRFTCHFEGDISYEDKLRNFLAKIEKSSSDEK